MVLKAADFPRWCRVGYLNSALHFTPPPPQDPIPGRRQFSVVSQSHTSATIVVPQFVRTMTENTME